ncbi:methylmalonyl-CoA epimerase [Tepidibacillus fermentans]|uniref:Methylmalonyl-CoA epimerase n=1 Tax=Tepidibacillus fermentans TaxID=1281767 RepID=A0A4R3KJW0_9BACI|nr:methylmalonyl-CoA epimerase [Tepidibacillus fermentans]TCS84065.1 methylmalonyl-CoA epimerase [Tepidibacillus fermentans]
MNKTIRVLIAKPGLDGHDRGALVIAQGLRDEGMEVIYSGLRQTPEQIVATAIQEDVDCIGLSILSGAHNELLPEVMRLLKENQAEEILVIGGGVIPDDDIPFLKEHGIAEIFTPGASMKEIADFIRDNIEKKNSKQTRSTSVKKIDHIGIAVKSLDEAVPFYKEILGLTFLGMEEVLDEGVKVAFFEAGGVRIELLEPLHQESPIYKHIEKRGEGIHHLAFEVEDIVDQFSKLQERQISLLQNQPRRGAHDTKVGFIHPKSSHKVLIELCEKN